MKRIALVAGSLLALSGAAVLASGCGSSETSSSNASSAGTTPAREAASKPAPEKCPERSSHGFTLSIINKTESVLYPSGEGWQCRSWSGWGNPSALSGLAIGPGQEKSVRLEASFANKYDELRFTINFRFGTNVEIAVAPGVRLPNGGTSRVFVKMLNDQGREGCEASRLLPGRFGPDTMRATFNCSMAANALTLEQVPPKQG
ncbi:MAG: hypothetical protein KGQ95_04125 [Acidobacteria bacterium]|nr:hypothetical protein [Acidobacteriota bacterium]